VYQKIILAMKKMLLFFPILPMMILLLECRPDRGIDPLSLVSQLDENAPENSLTGKEEQAGWKLLFDGQSLTGWHGYNMKGIPGCWIAEENSITLSTEGGAEGLDLVTDETYGSFALSLEFKLSEGANSGIIFQVAEDSAYGFPYETGPEYQVIDDQHWPEPLEDWQLCGANYAMYPPAFPALKPLGEWNHAFLVVDGNRVTQILNGKKVAEYVKYSGDWTARRNSGKWTDYPDYGKYDTGHIALQNHGSRVWYRNIKIKRL
jgi:hypothetical protein